MYNSSREFTAPKNDLTVDARPAGAQPQERPIRSIRIITADLREATLRHGHFRSKTRARTIADCPPYPTGTTDPVTRRDGSLFCRGIRLTADSRVVWSFSPPCDREDPGEEWYSADDWQPCSRHPHHAA